MKGTTIYWLGIKHIGVANSQPEVKELPAKEMPKEILRFMAATSLAKRIEIVIARTESEVRHRFNGGMKGNDVDIMEDLDSAWAEIEKLAEGIE